MAVPISELIAWRDKLIEARMSNVREAQDSNGERIRYASDSEMAAAIAAADRMISGVATTLANTIRFSTSKGL